MHQMGQTANFVIILWTKRILMTLTYIYHSGFALQAEGGVLTVRVYRAS